MALKERFEHVFTANLSRVGLSLDDQMTDDQQLFHKSCISELLFLVLICYLLDLEFTRKVW